MKKNKKILVFLIASWCFGLVSAQELPQLEALAQEKSWLKLVHYETDRGSPTGLLSAIHSPEFFLEPVQGPVSPRAELLATFQGMQQSAEGVDPDAHAQCRFPARKQWLEKQLGRPFAPNIRCPKFDEWTRGGAVESLSIVLATGYLGNPASYYGHTLLKLNFRADETHSALQDVSVNYGALLTQNDDPVTYMLKGVFGGYEGGFSHTQQYYHNHNYGENELRDLWEYRLNLPAESVRAVLGHAWEVLGKKYDYFFFRKNCAYRMAELIQILDGVDVIPDRRPYTIPQALLVRIQAAEAADGKPLVDRVIYHPSRQSRFYASYQQLDSAEHGVFSATVSADGEIDPHFDSLVLKSQYAVIDALIDYYQFVADSKERAAGKLHPGYVNALSMRYKLPPAGDGVSVEQPASPAEGRPPSWLQMGVREVDGTGRLVVRVRPAYYDALDAGAGHVPYAGLSMGDVHLEVVRGAVKLKRLDVISIDSTNPRATGLPGDRGKAWKLRLGLEQARLGCSNCTVARAQGDVGLGRQVTAGLYLAAYVGGAVQHERAGQGRGFGRVSADLIVFPAEKLGLKLSYEQRHAFSGMDRRYAVWQAELRYAVTAGSDIRLRYEKDGVSATSLAYGVYW